MRLFSITVARPREAQPRIALTRPCDRIQIAHTALRMLADRGLPGKHHCIDFLVHGIRDVSRLGTRRNRILDHRFEQVRRDDRALSMLLAQSNDATLYIRQLGNIDLYAEVAARHHDAVGYPDDVLYVVDAFRVLDLGDDLDLSRLSAEMLAQHFDIFRAAHERERDEIDLVLHAEIDIGSILLGNRREVHANSG